MKEQTKWRLYESRWRIRDLYFDKILRQHIFVKYLGFEPKIYFYGGKRLHRIESTNRLLTEAVLSERPYMAARFGNTEIHIMAAVLKRRLLGESAETQRELEKWFERLCNGAGFFPKDPSFLEKYTDVMLEACREVDLLGMWHRPMEDYLLKEEMPSAEITYLRWLEPWYSRKPWTAALKGKKVLVIHPFEQSILSQYRQRDRLFPGTDILPEFDLQVLKAVQTSAGGEDSRFADWFEALDYMYAEAMKREFEVAIIGCGAYGMPLAAMLKKAGKKAIHLGGVTQILFGIKGRRWVESPIDKKIPFNENWVYPCPEETPVRAGSVENGCYW
ncbi:MAG TPA: hypothetical protein H9761_18375 [Candidatus Eisenbergiella merdavium]|uniref:Uncharacterized protein n=1 Tax=Candidatus Eisenbergiella merdavium TaxID=2838551 RepID=A0A9D2NJM3_9FIRM|nr:hypothetical protein [Candidatus Eisenbergiella merdavium]